MVSAYVLCQLFYRQGRRRQVHTNQFGGDVSTRD
jgi:hypothetical protein